MLENLIIWLCIALGVMSASTMFLAFWTLKLQDENDRLKIQIVEYRSPF